jgi:hypothetical protein
MYSVWCFSKLEFCGRIAEPLNNLSEQIRADEETAVTTVLDMAFEVLQERIERLEAERPNTPLYRWPLVALAKSNEKSNFATTAAIKIYGQSALHWKNHPANLSKAAFWRLA